MISIVALSIGYTLGCYYPQGKPYMDKIVNYVKSKVRKPNAS